MGQNQSNNAPGEQEQGDAQTKVDYYELLGVDRLATDEDIKRAYRKKALELHPDRNYGNVEETTALFAEVQSAYEVLSDSQERAWYDTHRDAILRSSNSTAGGEYVYNVYLTTADDILKFITLFNGRIQFTDSPAGFYGSLRDIFEKLAHEEELACKWEGLEAIDYPSFGCADDNYEDVVRPFYALWSGFVTRKSYSWKDFYRYSEAPDRRIRRAMEKENKRLREESIREFNDAVRSLVAFVRKRDPRYMPNSQSEAERQKALRHAALAQAARSRAANEAKLADQTIPDWAKTEWHQEESDGEEEDSEQEYFECVVCGKAFKSENQLQVHEKSKKHIKAIKQLRHAVKKENMAIYLKEGESSMPTTPEVQPEDDAEEDTQDHATPITCNRSAQAPKAEPPDRTNEEDEGERRDFGEDHAPREEVTERVTEVKLPESDADSAEDEIAGRLASSTIEADCDTPPKTGKAKQRRAKVAAQKQKATRGEASSEFKCAACQAEFPSKTRLFNHIKEFNHAQPVVDTGKSRQKGRT